MAQASLDKDAAYAEMRAIGAELDGLRASGATDGTSQRADVLRARFGELQSALGGDDPTQVQQAAASARPLVPAVPRGAGPTAPPGMTVSVTSATNATPVAIADNATATSTVTIAGAGPYLWDVDLLTSITHTFPGDVDLTLTSPAGTSVTITTDNGGSNDNAHNGTFWDDDADPDGVPPYASNAGMVNDHPYALNTLASPLAPEEALGAFRGQDPNGTWTLTISDDASGDVGSLATWTLDVFTLTASPANTTTNFTNATPVTIVDNATATSTIAVAGLGTTITDVDFLSSITHTFPGDIDLALTSPGGTTVSISTDNAGSNDNVWNGTTWNDSADPDGVAPYVTNAGLANDHPYALNTLATPLATEEGLSAFVGENPNGTWTLTVSDDATGDVGSIATWSLAITTGVAPCTITCPANVTQANDPNQCGAVINYPAPVASAGCGTVTCTPAAGSFFPVGATTTTCTTTAGPSCTFTNTVNDTQAPVLTCPANVTGAATSAAGAVLTFAAPTVVDNCPGVGAAICTPASGSTFPIGTTAATCSAADAAMNAGTCGFNGTVVSPDIAVTKTSGSTGSPVVGQTVVFTLTATNGSTVGATGVSVVDTLPASLAHVSNTCGATVAGQVVTWNVGNLAAGGTSTCQITTRIASQGAITNSASATSTTFDNNPGNDTGTVSLGSALGAVIPTLSLGGLALLAALMLVIGYRRRARNTH